MTGHTDYTARHFLDWITGKAAMPALATPVYLALFTAVGSDAGTGFAEPAGNGYARAAAAAASWNSAAGSAPSSTSNAATIAFATPSGTGWGTVVAWGLYDAASAGNLLIWDYLGNFPWLPFTCSAGSPGVLDGPGHGYANGDQVVVTAEYGGALPPTAGSWSGLLAVAGVAGDTFTLGVNTTGTGSGMVRKVTAQPVAQNVVLSFAGGTPGALVLTDA